jgi:rubrerythrin
MPSKEGTVQNPKRKLEAVKKAIMFETHGLRFYQVAAERCTNPRAREMFSDLSRDELRHRRELSKQFRSILKKGKWSPPPASKEKGLKFKDPVIDAGMKKDIDGAWFDSAALNIGLMLEKRAMDYYRRQAAAASDPEMKAIFQWLLSWEEGHLRRLQSLEQAFREEMWNEAGFWPLD